MSKDTIDKSWIDLADGFEYTNGVYGYINGAQDFRLTAICELEKYQEDLIEPDIQLERAINIIKQLKA